MPKPNFRIAMRQEGENWNCYLALPNTMDNAVLLGHLSMGLAKHPELKHRFIELMQRAAELAGGQVFDVKPAPEHEKSGRG